VRRDPVARRAAPQAEVVSPEQVAKAVELGHVRVIAPTEDGAGGVDTRGVHCDPGTLSGSAQFQVAGPEEVAAGVELAHVAVVASRAAEGETAGEGGVEISQAVEVARGVDTRRVHRYPVPVGMAVRGERTSPQDVAAAVQLAHVGGGADDA